MSHIFNSENCINWWCLLLLMLLSFLLGYFLSRWLNGKSSKDALERCHDENKRLKLLGGNKPKEENEHANSTFSTKKIKAKKTMERSGKAVGKTALNFSSFGTATEADKDDLKKISGVGPFIEKKLNAIGIYTFEQVSKFSDEDIKNVTDLIEFFPGRIIRDDWRGQSNVLKDGGQTDFSKRVDSKDIDYNKEADK